MKKLKLSFAMLLIVVMTAASAVAATTASSAPSPSPVTAPSTLPITGSIPSLGGTFTGTLSNLHFVNQNGVLAVQGLLTGTLTNALGTVIGTVTNVPITLPISAPAANGSCTILNLTLGPLDLNLLGLVVHLDQVHLLITGQTGPGNLLGNLLCGLANALNGGGGGGLAHLLNNLLGL
jgi:hypothetical protein